MEYFPEISTVGYVNDNERNLNVWCSISRVSQYPEYSGRATIGLIAGCFVHDTQLTVSIFYKWLGIIISQPKLEHLFLFRCSDPRRMRFKLGPIALPDHGVAMSHHATETIEPGHYILYERDSNGQYLGCWPTLDSFIYHRRSRTASQTCTPSPLKPDRDAATRIAVRKRDLGCLITEQKAEPRARGGNFTGLEVAHIFPLMGAGDAIWMAGMSPSLRREVNTRQLADRPQNAMLLRADIHSLFDDYQWGIWIEQGRKPRLFRFERSGATALAEYESGVQISSVTLGATHPPNTQLLQHHFRIALLLHVRGFGVRLRAGATMI